MKIVTTKKIYVGRTDREALKLGKPHPEYGYCYPVFRVADDTPLFIPENTEIVKIGTNEEFSSLEEFYDSIEEGMYDFIIDEKLRQEFDEAVENALGTAYFTSKSDVKAVGGIKRIEK